MSSPFSVYSHQPGSVVLIDSEQSSSERSDSAGSSSAGLAGTNFAASSLSLASDSNNSDSTSLDSDDFILSEAMDLDAITLSPADREKVIKGYCLAYVALRSEFEKAHPNCPFTEKALFPKGRSGTHFTARDAFFEDQIGHLFPCDAALTVRIPKNWYQLPPDKFTNLIETYRDTIKNCWLKKASRVFRLMNEFPSKKESKAAEDKAVFKSPLTTWTPLSVTTWLPLPSLFPSISALIQDICTTLQNTREELRAIRRFARLQAEKNSSKNSVETYRKIEESAKDALRYLYKEGCYIFQQLQNNADYCNLSSLEAVTKLPALHAEFNRFTGYGAIY